jgi:4-methyl-5(b-hydroxyethyl)-thiazole monophosphate biosynthesis
MNKRVLVPLADGFEEIETMTIVDILRRAQIDVTIASVGDKTVTGRSKVKVVADCNIDDALKENPYDMIVLPGGLPNAYTLRDDKRVTEAVAKAHKEGRFVAAICAAPAVLQEAGVLTDAKATNYPGVRSDLPEEIYVEKSVVESGKIITSRGPGTAMEFALALVRKLAGIETAGSVAKDVLAGFGIAG